MSTKRAPCPRCDRGPRDDAMAVTTDEHGTVSYCHRCGYVEVHHNEVRRHVVRVRPRAESPVEPLDWSTKAAGIWHRTQSLRGTLGETYLRSRNCLLPPRDSHLRFLPSSAKFPPSLCACVTDVRSGKPISLHFTRLRSDGTGKAGTEYDKLLLSGHRKKGGCIRLWPDDCVGQGLALAEGIESALAAAHVHTPIWACIDAGNLESFPVLRGIDELTIYADHDARGIEAAQTCADRWRDAGRSVRVRVPKQPGCDTADIAQRLHA